MRARSLTRVAAVVAMVAAGGAAALAQAGKAPEWNQTVTKEPGTEGPLSPKQLDLVQKVTAYFNQMGDMKGDFVQTSPDGKKLRGKIYVKRPGYFRFEYNRPSRQLVISDSKNMIIQDLDLKTDDRWGLDKTPFRIVLRKDVDLLRDAKVLDVGETDDRIYVALQDKSPDTVGKLKLFISKRPGFELKEWISTDSQGQDTKVELTEFVPAPDLDPQLFVPSNVALDKLRQ